MNIFMNITKAVLLCSAMTFVIDAQAQWDRGGWDRDRDRGGWDRDRGGRSERRIVEEVHFRDGKTAVAIENCQRARASDRRCSSPGFECSPCSEIAHSDHSSYIVYQLVNGGGGGGYPGRPGRPGRPDDGRPGRGDREFVQTFHFTDKKTAVAHQKCETARSRMPECSSSRYECTPCTIESHTDHSQFDLYRYR